MSSEHLELKAKDIEQDHKDIDCFVNHHRTLDTCIAVLYRQAMALANTERKALSPLLLELLAGVPRPTLCEKYNLSGDKALIKALRDATRPLLD